MLFYQKRSDFVYSRCMADTREQILGAAWELFSEKGFETVSVRDVTSLAGVNLASVSYHFGGKDGLIQEIVKRCLSPICEYGVQLLKEAEEKYGSYKEIPISEILTCWLRPTLMPEECGGRFDLIMRLTARYLIDADYSVPLPSARLLNVSFESYADAIMSHGYPLSKDQVVKQLIYMEGAAIYAAGLGGVMMQVVNGHAMDSCRVAREKVLKDVVSCAMLGFHGGDSSCAVVSVG